MEKLHEMIMPFDGTSGVEVETWLRKMKLIAKLKNIADLHNFVPLYLNGAAFAIYDHLSDADKKDAEKIENALLLAFAQDAFGAYDSFRKRSLLPGEQVDVFLADLWRLARLAKVASEDLVRFAFICGLPCEVSAKLRATANISSTDLSTVAAQARIYMTHENEYARGAFAAVRTEKTKHSNGTIGMKCYNCGGRHPARYCREIVCWNCGHKGHRSFDCSGNDQGESFAPAVSHRQ